MPKRGEFEVEYNNDAEDLLAEMELNDSDEEQLANNDCIRLYNELLDERIRRKRYLIERNQLIEKRFKSKEEKTIACELKQFGRFMHSQEQFDHQVQSLLKERFVNEVANQFMISRNKGLTYIKQVAAYIENFRKERPNLPRGEK
jgi:transcriptional adapter 2-alpha